MFGEWKVWVQARTGSCGQLGWQTRSLGMSVLVVVLSGCRLGAEGDP